MEVISFFVGIVGGVLAAIALACTLKDRSERRIAVIWETRILSLFKTENKLGPEQTFNIKTNNEVVVVVDSTKAIGTIKDKLPSKDILLDSSFTLLPIKGYYLYTLFGEISREIDIIPSREYQKTRVKYCDKIHLKARRNYGFCSYLLGFFWQAMNDYPISKLKYKSRLLGNIYRWLMSEYKNNEGMRSAASEILRYTPLGFVRIRRNQKKMKYWYRYHTHSGAKMSKYNPQLKLSEYTEVFQQYVNSHHVMVQPNQLCQPLILRMVFPSEKDRYQRKL